MNKKLHWEEVYQTKTSQQVSWTQQTPETSLTLIRGLGLPLDSSIIDIGGGDSTLVDHLLTEGYHHISVLDISEAALERAQTRLKKSSDQVSWLPTDILSFDPVMTYTVWHDRATFHFLTQPEDIEQYVSTVEKAIQPRGYLIIGTFSEDGPVQCSGLPVRQYSEGSLSMTFKKSFQKVYCFHQDHQTPFDTIQNFIFCVFQKWR
jgi:2-polyprenyl-3-methyl-5-hydroxy-6-metoxy-1,4-benzoquinol methylase